MPRIRSVYPDICTDETMAEVSARAERTFVRLWTHLDDAGRCLDNVKLIKAALYPLHDAMTAVEVTKDLLELEEHGLVVRYEVDGKPILAAKPEVWSCRQRPRHPKASDLPPAPSGKPAAKRRKPPAERNEAPDKDGETCQVVVGVDVGVDVELAPPQSAAARKQDLLWNALMASCGISSGEITPSSRGKYNQALKEIRDAGGTVDTIAARARSHLAKWPNASLTPNSLAKHWAELGPPPVLTSSPREPFQEAIVVEEAF